MADIYYIEDYPYTNYITLQNYEDVVQVSKKWSVGQHICINKTVRFEDRILELPANSTGLFWGMRGFETGDHYARVDASKCTNMTDLFRKAWISGGTQTADFRTWDVSNVTTMSGMFAESGVAVGQPTILCNGWNLSKVTDVGIMFDGVEYLQSVDLHGWDVSNIQNFNGMFNSGSLKRIFVDPDTDWSKMVSSTATTNHMFYFASNLPNFDYRELDVRRANTIDGYGYFTGDRVKYTVYLKV